ncbi:putative RING finger protein P32A8.03c [Pseudocercospora fuligena]|uniref:Putative RING finger protein P32A8.03c n=1 Tax=Pseudocercospora fuligena TaxID=685502 RepID=A0A8H6VGU9_9PEZI|nr:putative RING finger protein P32A8.03c [Pseudocercospora fuligena]
MSRRPSSSGRPHRSFADNFPLPPQNSQETRDRRPRLAPLPFPPMTPNAPRADSHLGQLLQATGVRPYDTRIVTPTSNPYQLQEPSPLSRSYGTRIIEPDIRAGTDTDHDFDRFIDTDDLEEADLPGLPGSFATRSYAPTAPNSLSRLQNVLGQREGPRGPPPSPTFSDDAMDAIGFRPTMPPYRPAGSGSLFRDRAPGRDLEQEMEATIAGPHPQWHPAEMDIEEDHFDHDFDPPAGNDALRLADDLLRQATELETRVRNGAGRNPATRQATRQALRDVQDSARAMLQSLADPAAQPRGPAISIDALPKREITVTDQGEDGHATCSICQEHLDIGTAVTQLSCPHWFCTDCLEPWLHNRTCPTCRAPINA